MMNKHTILIGLIILVFMASCTWDAMNPKPDTCIGLHNELFAPIQKDTCTEIPSAAQGGYIRLYPDTASGFPCFNPRGKEEVIYVKYVQNVFPRKQELWKLDLCTGEKQYLIDNIRFRPAWHANGWIVFVRGDSQIWMIKEDGDSLKQVTTAFGGKFDPIWHPDGSKIVFWTSRDGIVTVDSNHESYDTLGIRTRFPRFSPDKTKVPIYFSAQGGTPEQLGYYDFKSQEYVRLVNVSHSIGHILWLDNKTMIWNDGTETGGVFSINIETKEVNQLQQNCESKTYLLLSISKDNKWFLYSRSHQEYLGNNRLWHGGFFTLTGQNGNNPIDLLLE